jgi:hypothetical protein
MRACRQRKGARGGNEACKKKFKGRNQENV